MHGVPGGGAAVGAAKPGAPISGCLQVGPRPSQQSPANVAGARPKSPAPTIRHVCLRVALTTEFGRPTDLLCLPPGHPYAPPASRARQNQEPSRNSTASCASDVRGSVHDGRRRSWVCLRVDLTEGVAKLSISPEKRRSDLGVGQRAAFFGTNVGRGAGPICRIEHTARCTCSIR